MGKKVSSARKRHDYDAVRQNLQLLKGTEYMTEDLRMSLAVAKLKTSRKDLSREFRISDYALSLIADMLHAKGKKFSRKFLQQKELTDDEYFYIGYHFVEKLHEERRFGAECLQFIITKWKKSKAAKLAKKRLSEEKII